MPLKLLHTADWQLGKPYARVTDIEKRSRLQNERFESPSGGAKEQVAAAVRLATTEILAANHDGCLPVLFDDSFAYSDDTRIQSLQSMLDLAATRGLQVLVLTCTPADYVGFGAKELRLPPTIQDSGENRAAPN